MAKIRAFEPRECSRIRELLDHFLVGELSVETNQHILSHLEQCAGCREEERSRAETRSLLVEAWRAQPVPPGLEEKVADRIASGRRAIPQYLSRVAGLVLVAVGVAGVIWIFSPLSNRGLLMAVDHYQEVASDHVNCSGHRVPSTFLAPLEAIQTDLIELLSSQPHRYQLLDIRLCQKGEANLVHYAFQGSSGRLSLVLEERAEGEHLFLRGDEPHRNLHQLDVNLVRESATTLAVFATDRFLVYLVTQEQDEEVVFQLANKIIPILQRTLQGPARTKGLSSGLFFQIGEDEPIPFDDFAHRHFEGSLEHGSVVDERMELTIFSAGIHT